MAKKTKAQDWATRTPEERAKLYRSMAEHLREVVGELGDAAVGREAQALGLTARQFQSAAGSILGQLELEKNPQCCASARMFGSCDGHSELGRSTDTLKPNPKWKEHEHGDRSRKGHGEVKR